MKPLLLTCAVAVVLVVPSTADAFGPQWMHRAKCLVGLGRCVDVPPRPGPQTPCNDSNRGAIERIWDARLQAYVIWVCTEEGWRRLRIVQAVELPWTPPHYRKVYDFHRACKSIVCKRIAVTHYYPTRWILGR